jgi:hypothetical protein
MSNGVPYGNFLTGEEPLPIETFIMNRRKVTLPDGRYLILFSFTPAPRDQKRDSIAKE